MVAFFTHLQSGNVYFRHCLLYCDVNLNWHLLVALCCSSRKRIEIMRGLLAQDLPLFSLSVLLDASMCGSSSQQTSADLQQTKIWQILTEVSSTENWHAIFGMIFGLAWSTSIIKNLKRVIQQKCIGPIRPWLVSIFFRQQVNLEELRRNIRRPRKMDSVYNEI